MKIPFSIFWVGICLLILLPTPAGRFAIDLAGGLLIALLVLPIILGVIGWIGWRSLQSKMIKCENCGTTSFQNSNQCPICGSELKITQPNQSNSNLNDSIPASLATIDITAKNSNSEE